MVAQSRYLPYGQSRWESGSTPTDFKFTSQRSEAGFGLYDYNARYYSPVLGRFISPDPIVPGIGSQEWNRYSYVRNNPLRYTDPSGHCFSGTIDTVICIGIAAAVVMVGMATQPADVLAPDDELAANHPPLEPGYHPAEYIGDLQNGQYVAGAVGVGIEFIPGSKLPGVKQITKGAGQAVLDAVADFVKRAGIEQAARPFGNRTFGGTWNFLAEQFSKGTLEGKLFSYFDENGAVHGMMQLKDTPTSSGELVIEALEGLGQGSGAGTKLFQQAVRESQQNFNGGIYLESTEEGYNWYMKLNPTKVADKAFYWSLEDAAKLLE